MNNEDSLLSISEAAKYLRTCTKTLTRWDKAGKLKAIRHPINNYRKYRLKDLKEILDKLNGTV